MESTDVVVIGAGVIGLAIARKFALEGRDVLILEAEDAIGVHTSSRNSEVIHAGIYYPPGSLKAKLCVAGRDKLYQYCVEHKVDFKRVGKLIVAVDESELADLDGYRSKASANGAGELEFLTMTRIAEMEPAVQAVGGLFSPNTGILDSHGLMLAYLGDAEDKGASLVLRTPVAGGKVSDEGIALVLADAEQSRIKARLVINCAGLKAPHVAHQICGIPVDTIPQAYYARGHYFSLGSKSPFHRLVYPIANHAGLGVHVTLDLAGNAKFGPDVSDWSSDIDYSFDESRKSYFVSAIQRYYPDLDPAKLMPGYVGVRPKISAPQAAAADFMIQGKDVHGLSSWISLYGIESPGLTASLAIADYVWELTR